MHVDVHTGQQDGHPVLDNVLIIRTVQAKPFLTYVTLLAVPCVPMDFESEV